MALTEIQIQMASNLIAEQSKMRFYSIIQDTAGQLSEAMHKFKVVADFINRMEATDLDALTIPAGAVRTDLINFKIVLNYFVSLWDGQAVTPAVSPQTTINALRRINQG